MLSFENVSYRYADRDESVLHELSLRVEKGEFLAVVGHNGSGKSTLAKHCNALLLPQSGDVWVDGINTRDEARLFEIRQKVGVVFQNPDNQIVTTVVEEDIAFGPENLGVPSEEIRVRVEEALRAVGMENHAESAPHMLSGGQKQRVAIAGMLAMEPQVLVLDEATSMLDPRGRRDVLRIVQKLNRERGMTVIMITQHMEEAVWAGRVAVMDRGKLLLCAPPREVFAQSALLRAHRLDVPEMAKLRDALLEEGWDLPRGSLTMEDMTQAICRSL